MLNIGSCNSILHVAIKCKPQFNPNIYIFLRHRDYERPMREERKMNLIDLIIVEWIGLDCKEKHKKLLHKHTTLENSKL